MAPAGECASMAPRLLHQTDAPAGGTSCAAEAPAADMWQRLRREAHAACVAEPALRAFVAEAVLASPDFFTALAHLLARKLSAPALPAALWQECFDTARALNPGIAAAAQEDLSAVLARDPAAENALVPFLCYKGFHALQCHRAGHALWAAGQRLSARMLQSRVSEVFAVDIHPAVAVGRRVFIDHGTGIVVGETAAIGDDVSILHQVTLGGTGKERGDRHPKVGDGALLCVGAMVLGNVEIGQGVKVGAGSVVLRPVPPGATVVGVPARSIEGNAEA